MKLVRMCVVLVLLLSVGIAVFAAGDREQAPWPNRTIQIIVPYNPGGDTDLTARVFAKHLPGILDNPVVVTNMAGAAGSVGSRHVKDANADGYSVLFYHPSFFMNKLVGMTDYDHNDFEVVAVPAFADTDVIVVSSKSPYKSMGDLVNAAKRKPGEITYAASLGAYSYIQAVAIEEDQGIEFNKVDIGGGAEKLAAILGGHLETSVFISNMIPDYIESGQLRIIGQFGPVRSQYIPDFPTLIEQRIDVAFEKFYFMAMPKGTPSHIVEKFADAVRQVVESQEGQADFRNLYITGRFIGGKDAVAYMNEEWKSYEQLTDLLD